MKTFNDYNKETEKIVDEVDRGSKGLHNSTWIYYAMVLVGVLVTGSLTYSLCHQGMSKSPLWKAWVDVASFLPVVLLEGSALALMYGRHYLFRSEDQRSLGHLASKIIWVVLIASSISEFALGYGDGEMPPALRFYASYVLPLAIVCVPVLWKTLYDRHPVSRVRAAVLDADAAFREGLLQIQRIQDEQILEEFAAAVKSATVKAARGELFEKSAIEHAQKISSFIDENRHEPRQLPPARPVNGAVDWEDVESGKEQRH